MVDMVEYYNFLKTHNLDIIYSGPLWSDGIEGIGGTLRRRMEFDELPLSVSQSVFSVFIEQMNNMLMYSAEHEHFKIAANKNINAPKGVFILGVKDNSYFIQSGNVVNNNNVEFLKKRIDYINTLNKEELRKFYKEQLKSENLNPDSKGAGIGLIEIARRSSSKIEYEFKPYKTGLSFFSMYVTVNSGGGL